MPLKSLGGNRKRAAEGELESGRGLTRDGRDPPRAIPDVPGGIAIPEPPDWSMFTASNWSSPWRRPDYAYTKYARPTTKIEQDRLWNIQHFLAFLLTDKAGEYPPTSKTRAVSSLTGRILKATTTLSAQVQRFIDPAQTKFEGNPSPLGDNLVIVNPDDPTGTPLNGSYDLAYAYNTYKSWMTALHLDSLVRVQLAEDGLTKTMTEEHLQLFEGDDPFNARRLWQMEGKEAARRTFETQGGDPRDFTRHRSSIGTSTPRHPFQWVLRWRQWLVDAAEEVLAICVWFGSDSLTEELLKDAEEAVQQVVSRLPPAASMLMTLIEAENTFEEALYVNHVEDEVINKRLVIFSETEATKLRDMKEALFITLNRENAYRAKLAPVSRNFRKSFNYRLLRDWGYGRAWKKLFMIFPAKLQEVVDQINASFDRKHGKLCYDLFDVHPKTRADLEIDDACHACQEDYEDGQMKMLLRCDHHMHPACAFSTWDVPHKFQFLCPICRYDPLTFREKVKFPIERIDEDWFKVLNDVAVGHAREELVNQELHIARQREFPEDWPEGIWGADRYYAVMIDYYDKQHIERGRDKYDPLPFGGGTDTAATRVQIENEANAKEAERQLREGITKEEALQRSRDALRHQLIAQNPQYMADREKARRHQEEQTGHYTVVETGDGPTLQRIASDAEAELDQRQDEEDLWQPDPNRIIPRSPPQYRPRQAKMPPAFTPRPPMTEEELQRQIEIRGRRFARLAELRRQAAVRRDAERAERVAQGLRASPDPETDDQGTGGMDVGTGVIIENNDSEVEDED